MNKVEFYVGSGSGRATHDAAIVLPHEDPREALIEAVISSISTEVWVEVAGVRAHLAAWQDPEHWAEEWEERGVEDVDALIAGAVGEFSPKVSAALEVVEKLRAEDA